MASPNDPGRGRRTPLHVAIENKDLPQLEKLLKKWPDDINVSGGQHGETPLAYAVYKNDGWLEGVQVLVDHGADLNAAKGMRRTPLMLAGEFGRAEIAEVLLKAGADSSPRSLNGRDAAGWARAYNHEALAVVLSEAAENQLTLQGGGAAEPKALTNGGAAAEGTTAEAGASANGADGQTAALAAAPLLILQLGATNDASGAPDADVLARCPVTVALYEEAAAAGRVVRVLTSGGEYSEAEQKFGFNPTPTPHWHYVEAALLRAGEPACAPPVCALGTRRLLLPLAPWPRACQRLAPRLGPLRRTPSVPPFGSSPRAATQEAPPPSASPSAQVCRSLRCCGQASPPCTRCTKPSCAAHASPRCATPPPPPPPPPPRTPQTPLTPPPPRPPSLPPPPRARPRPSWSSSPPTTTRRARATSSASRWARTAGCRCRTASRR